MLIHSFGLLLTQTFLRHSGSLHSTPYVTPLHPNLQQPWPCCVLNSPSLAGAACAGIIQVDELKLDLLPGGATGHTFVLGAPWHQYLQSLALPAEQHIQCRLLVCHTVSVSLWGYPVPKAVSAGALCTPCAVLARPVREHQQGASGQRCQELLQPVQELI